jgi:1-acyl-sn-glycerol-3-phosphate acyltransferase
MVFYANHPSWWDPLVAIALRNRFFPEHRAFAPIDAAALQKYKFFAKLGFFPVTRDRRGALHFLRTAEAVLNHPSHILLVTPQGRFADTRERPVEFKPGLGHLALRMPDVAFVPLALDYAFWNERKAEVLLRFGPPTRPATLGHTAKMDAGAWTKFFQGELERTQDALAEDAVSRDPSRFDTFLQSQSGVGGVYDLWRRFRAFCRNEPFQPEHHHL